MRLPVTLSGTVSSGSRTGRKFDMPTANITPSEDVSDLPYGVYFSTICIDGEIYPGITDLGVRPTVSDDGGLRAETFIYDYDGDLYTKKVTVTLLEFRRKEMKFDSLDDLYRTVRDDFRAGALFHGISV